jgi:signal transduction histidine kinase
MTSSGRKSIRNRLYRVFIAPRQQEQQARNREIVSNIVLAGTSVVMAAFFLLLLFSFGVVGNTYILGRVVVGGVALLYLGGTFWLSRTRHFRSAAYLLVFFYGLLASGMVLQWSINTPSGILMLGLFIVLASTLLGSRHALYAAAIACAVVMLSQIGFDAGFFKATHAWQEQGAGLGDAIGYCLIFIILAIVSWLFGRQVERSLARMLEAEAALQREKAMLKIRVRDRTLQLRKIQVEEMQQMYNFAEIGQLSTSLLHDLANYLTVLTLEMENLHSKQHSAAIERTQQIIGHLDTMVDSVRDRLQGNVQDNEFNLAEQVNEVVQFMQYKASEADVRLDWELPSAHDRKGYSYVGDPIRFSQVVTVLVTNAIDAYKRISADETTDRRIHVKLTETKQRITLRVTDWGEGISRQQRKLLFKPLHSTTKNGMGIGLYIAKQMVELHFKGTLFLEPALEDRTEFVVTLAKRRI